MKLNELLSAIHACVILRDGAGMTEQAIRDRVRYPVAWPFPPRIMNEDESRSWLKSFGINPDDPIQKTTWTCRICGREFDNPADCQACMDRGFKSTLNVGDVLIWKSGHRWFGGDRINVRAAEHRHAENFDRMKSDPAASRWAPWIHSTTDTGENSLAGKHTVNFYVVVTAITGWSMDGHDPRYHVATCGVELESGRKPRPFQKNLNSWEITDKCVRVAPDEVPEAIRAEVAAMVGMKAPDGA